MGLEKILMGVVAVLSQSIACFICFKSFIDYKNKKRAILFLLSLVIYYTLVVLFIPNYLRFITFTIYASLGLYFILEVKNKLILLYAFNTILFFAISEILISLILVMIGVNSTDIINNLFYNTLANILISSLTVGLIYFPLARKLIKKEIVFFKSKKKILNYLYILMLIIYLLIAKNGLEFVLKSNYYVNILFIISIVFILTLIIKKELKSEQLKEENHQMLNYVSKYEKIITEQGKANHEFKNQLMVIRGYAQMNSPKLIEYIDSITEDTKKTQGSYMISQLNKFPDGGIKGLLYYKLATMTEENISYDLQVEPGVKLKLSKLSVVMYKNITKILGVLLDNAIDASKKSKLKKIIISVEKDNNNVIFNIQNSYKGKIELSKFGTGYTTKGSKHGYGLKLVKDILDESNQFDIEKSCDKEYFYTRLILKVNNKKRKSNK